MKVYVSAFLKEIFVFSFSTHIFRTIIILKMGLNEKVKGLKISDVYYLLFRGLGGFGHFLNLKNRVFFFP